MGFPLTVQLTGADVLRTTTDKRHPFGTRGVTRDGRSFRYARNGAVALLAGVPIQSSLQQACELTLDTGTTKMRANTSRIAVITTGTSPFQTGTAIQSYAEAYIWARTSTSGAGVVTVGCGQYAQIKSNTTQSASKNVVVWLDLVDGDAFYSATTNFGTTQLKLGLVRNPYDKVLVKPSGVITGPIMGAAVRPIGANTYFWIQTWGPCPCRVSPSKWDTGDVVGLDTGTSARFGSFTSTKAEMTDTSCRKIRYIFNNMGVAMVGGISGEYRMVSLKIAP